MYIIFELMGTPVQTEKQTSNGRIDIFLQTKDYIYVMELKVDGSADEALAQIEEKGYTKPFAADSRRENHFRGDKREMAAERNERRGGHVGDFAPDRGNSRKFIPFISSNSRSLCR